MKGLGTQQHFLEEENESTPYLEKTFELILFAFANHLHALTLIRGKKILGCLTVLSCRSECVSRESAAIPAERRGA